MRAAQRNRMRSKYTYTHIYKTRKGPECRDKPTRHIVCWLWIGAKPRKRKKIKVFICIRNSKLNPIIWQKENNFRSFCLCPPSTCAPCANCRYRARQLFSVCVIVGVCGACIQRYDDPDQTIMAFPLRKCYPTNIEYATHIQVKDEEKQWETPFLDLWCYFRTLNTNVAQRNRSQKRHTLIRIATVKWGSETKLKWKQTIWNMEALAHAPHRIQYSRGDWHSVSQSDARISIFAFGYWMERAFARPAESAENNNACAKNENKNRKKKEEGTKKQ